MKSHAKILQQKGRRISVQLQESVDKEIEPLLAEGYIEKVHEIRDNVFMHVTVKTVKKNGLVKIALDPRPLNQVFDKGKYQMPNLDNILVMITENVENQNDETLYSSMDMTYAHGQVPLHSGRANHCTFQIIWDEANRYLPIYDRLLWPHVDGVRNSKSTGFFVSKT